MHQLPRLLGFDGLPALSSAPAAAASAQALLARFDAPAGTLTEADEAEADATRRALGLSRDAPGAKVKGRGHGDSDRRRIIMIISNNRIPIFGARARTGDE